MALPSLQPRSQRPTSGEAPELMPAGLGGILARAGVDQDLQAIERIMQQRVASRQPSIAASGAYTIAAGGKRLRAALVLLSAQLGHYEFERASHPAVAVELLHTASLVHDDLVDHAGQRRGRPTVHSRWDRDVSLVLGSYLFAVSAHELAAEPDPRIIRYYAYAAQTMVEGELSPVRQLQPLETALAQYRRKIAAKTAALFEVACLSGMAVAGGDEDQIAALGRFGYELGMAFQIVDDVLDFTGDEAVLGKPAGNDLREGTLTLPLIYAVDQSSSPLLRDLTRGAPEPARVPQIVAAVVASGGAARAMQDARAAIGRAMAELDAFPLSPARRALGEIGEFVLGRQQ